LFALIRMDQQHDFIMTHKISFWIRPMAKVGGKKPS
jgi:hypothetical protein